MRFNLIIGMVLLGIWSCSDTVEPIDERIGLNYQPMTVGTYRTYYVFEINFALVGTDTSTYQLRESVIDSAVVQGDDIHYEVLREVRIDSTEDWSRDSLWTVRWNRQRLIGVENNVPFVKLVFPLEDELSWDGNAYNAQSPEFYRYERLVADTVLNGTTFDNLWMVVQSELETDILGRDERHEIYAPDVGMVLKSIIIWNFCQSDCSSEDQVVAGRELRQSLISYGKIE